MGPSWTFPCKGKPQPRKIPWHDFLKQKTNKYQTNPLITLNKTPKGVAIN